MVSRTSMWISPPSTGTASAAMTLRTTSGRLSLVSSLVASVNEVSRIALSFRPKLLRVKRVGSNNEERAECFLKLEHPRTLDWVPEKNPWVAGRLDRKESLVELCWDLLLQLSVQLVEWLITVSDEILRWRDGRHLRRVGRAAVWSPVAGPLL